MRHIDKIIIHCSATKPSRNYDIDDCRRDHVEGEGWIDVGYHFFITRSGALQLGRQVWVVGAHAYGYNDTSIGICLSGGLDEDGQFSGEYTVEQWRTLSQLVDTLKNIFTTAEVLGHNDLPGVAKACPCFDVKKWYDGESE